MIMPKIAQKNKHNSSVSAVYAHFTAQLTIMPIPYSVILQKRICMRIIRCRSLMHFYFTDKSVFLILSLIRRIMDGDTESSSNPIRRNVSVSVSSAPSSPQMPTQHPSLCPLSTTIFQFRILPVDCKCILCQIVCPDRKEINLFR